MTILEVLDHSSFKEFTAVMASAITATATLLAVIVTNYHNKKIALINANNQLTKEKIERKSQRVEELYLILSKWKKDAFKTTILYAGYHNGKFPRADISENLPTAKGGLAYDPSKISVIVNIYFPELIELSEKVNECHTKLYISHESTKENNKNFILAMLKNQEVFDYECGKFLEQLAVIAKNL